MHQQGVVACRPPSPFPAKHRRPRVHTSPRPRLRTKRIIPAVAYTALREGLLCRVDESSVFGFFPPLPVPRAPAARVLRAPNSLGLGGLKRRAGVLRRRTLASAELRGFASAVPVPRAD